MISKPVYPPIPDLPIVFEDDWLLVVNKPTGMLSQPGKNMDGSVLSRVLDSERALHGPVLVHRLDMDTSGLLLLAKSRQIHRQMQQQFEKRLIRKRYQAILDGTLTGLGGRISLPLRLDIDNRPHQLVCAAHGKLSTTLWHCTTGSQLPQASRTAVSFYPLTGRTHQLRVHAADAQGLGAPIVGDRLYGHCNAEQENLPTDSSVPRDRLMLHADFLQFLHPHLREPLRIVCPAPF